MSRFDSVLASIKQESFYVKRQLLEATLRILQNIQKSGKPLADSDRAAILAFAYDQVEAFLLAIPNGASYKEKDLIFACEDLLLGIIMHVCPDSQALPQDKLARIQLLVDTVKKERYIETAMERLFSQASIDEADARELLSLVHQAEEEFQKGKLYEGLVHYKNQLSKLSDSAAESIAAHIVRDLERYLADPQLSGDCINNLEMAADVCRYFSNASIAALLYEVLKLGYCNVNFYAVDTLLFLGKEVPAETVTALAHNLEFANLTYGALKKYGKQALFPRECAAPEYLAKSDMVHWLVFPTELGKKPDEIEYLGKITYLFKKTVYYVFKYRSDSSTLDEELHNKWLIGWSSEDGGTFSNFDRLAHYRKATTRATLRNIKKKLIG